MTNILEFPIKKISQEEEIREIFRQAAIEFVKLARILRDIGGGDIQIPFGINITEEILERYYSEDYTFEEVFERTSGFKDPPPPSFHDVELFLEGKKEL